MLNAESESDGLKLPSRFSRRGLADTREHSSHLGAEGEVVS